MRWFLLVCVIAGVATYIGGARVAPAYGAQVECVEYQTCNGTDDNDALVGTNIADVIKGHDGADILHGRRGDDALLGGRKADNIFGGRGNDYVRAGGGMDYIDTVDGVFDLIDSCGRGWDIVTRDPFDFLADDCEDDHTEEAP